VWRTETNAAVAQHVWQDGSFLNLIYLTDVTPVAIPAAVVRAGVGYQPNAQIREFRVIDASTGALATTSSGFGSLEPTLGAWAAGGGASAPVAPPPAGPGTAPALRGYKAAKITKPSGGAAQRICNTDAWERGSKEHVETQNQLASMLAGLGHATHSPEPQQPQFDIAWDANGKRYLGEVKSVTPGNFVHQVRLAVGQVLRYRWELGGPFAPVIVTSRPPPDATWEPFLAALNVALVWRTGPGAFSAGTAQPTPW
jgi:hypothetical protein